MIDKRGRGKRAKPAAVSASANLVRQYYERNTRLFLLQGRRKQTGSIHRAVWAPGVSDLESALNYTNELVRLQMLILSQRSPAQIMRVADLGCGVGGSLFYLAARLPVAFWGMGMTISTHQARLAQQQAERLGLQDRCTFVEADYLALPLSGSLDALFSIEAFAHTPDAQRYFSEASRLLCTGGHLLLCDDFRGEHIEAGNFWLDAFQKGWHAPGILSPTQVEDLARGCGLCLVEQRNLTPYLRLSRLPAWIARRLVRAGLQLGDPYWQSVAGGIALQQALKTGIVAYRFLVFEKSV